MSSSRYLADSGEGLCSVSSSSTVLLDQATQRQLAVASHLAVGPNNSSQTGNSFRIVYERATNEYVRNHGTIFDPTDATKAEVGLFLASSAQFSEAVLAVRDQRVEALEKRCKKVFESGDPRRAVIDAWRGTREEKVSYLSRERACAYDLLLSASLREELHIKGYYSSCRDIVEPVFKSPPVEQIHSLRNLPASEIDLPTEFTYNVGHSIYTAPIEQVVPSLRDIMEYALPAQTEGSRRVVLWDLPYDTSLWAVLQIVASRTGVAKDRRGGIIRASLFWQPELSAGCTYSSDYSTKNINVDRSRSALIEFLDAGAAKAYVDYINQVEISIRTKFPGSRDWTKKRVQAYLAGSEGPAIAADVQLLLYCGQTRSMVIALCPPEVVYDLLRSFGMPTIARAWYQGDTHDLAVEFVSIIDANRVWQNICRGLYAELGISGLMHPIFILDSTERGFDAIPDGYVVETPPNPLEVTFNKSPYNKELNVFPLYVPGQLIPDDDDGDDDRDDLTVWLKDRSSGTPTRFWILGSNIVLTKKEMRWSVDPEDQIKLLMANTLHDPYYQEAWDRYFELRGLVNERKCDEYASYARERGAVCLNWNSTTTRTDAPNYPCSCHFCVYQLPLPASVQEVLQGPDEVPDTGNVGGDGDDQDGDGDDEDEEDGEVLGEPPIVLDDFLRPMQALDEFEQLSTIRMDLLVAQIVTFYAGWPRDSAMEYARSKAKNRGTGGPSKDLIMPRLWTKLGSFI